MFTATNPAQLTAYLRSLRRARGLTQTDLGARLGVSTARVSTMERNPGVMSTAQLMKLLQALGARLVVDADTGASPTRARRRNAGATGEW
jgi:HTH-type transcriptional regulator / antitoxin HipB